MSLHKLWLIAVPGLAVFVSACGGEAAAPPLPRPVVVEAPQPFVGPAGIEAFPGSVHAGVEADLSFRVPGKIAERKVDMGAHVKPGTVLAVLDPQDARLNLDAARASVAAAEADLWLAQEEEKRYRDLQTRGFVGQSLVDTRASTTKLAEARLDQARSQSKLARNQSGYTTLTADAAGVVTEIMAEPGNVVAAGQPVVRFAADGEREVHINLPEGRVEALRNAPRLAVTLYSDREKRYAGKVRDISPQADRATRTHMARVTIVGADEGVHLGATATVHLGAAGDGKTFRLPATAVGAQGDRRAVVWKLRNGEDGSATVEPVPVQVLQYFDAAVTVTGAIGTQDRLVTAGIHRLVAGMPVRPIERSAKAAL